MPLGWPALLALPACLCGAAPEPDALDAANVVWTTPSADSSGSMPLGNGDLALNGWVEPNGDLLCYLAKTDAWDAMGRLLKLGRVRVRLDPPLVRDGQPFRWTLRLRQGEIEVVAGETTVRVWVDANAPVVRVEAQSPVACRLTVSTEPWRTQRRTLKGGELFSAYGFAGGPEPVVVEADTVRDDQGDRLVWYHRNERSTWATTMRHQGLAPLLDRFRDPLLHRTFGVCVEGDGLVRRDARTLVSSQAARQHHVVLAALTRQGSVDDWLQGVRALAATARAADRAAALAAHRRWWDEFWNRSWIRVTDPTPVAGAGGITTNRLPLRLGADSEGANRFLGGLKQARVYRRALTAAEVQALAAGPDAPGPTAGLVGHWALAGAEGAVSAQGPVGFADGAAQFDGRGYLQVAHADPLDLTEALTLAAWVRPGHLSPAGGRLIDKSKAGTSNGYLLDTYPGRSLRLIVQAGTLTYDAILPTDRWTHVAATCDTVAGRAQLWVNGRPVATMELTSARRRAGQSVGQVVTQGYALQRFLFACAGRGAQPIKFNGSLFCVDAREKDGVYDADYRRWGDTYWFQNTRLAYWPMLAAGDWESMEPLWRLYREALPLALERTRLYFGHEGAFFPETLTFWGAYANENYGWHRQGKPVGQVANTYIRWYWSGALELLTLALDRLALAPDDAFRRDTLMPLARGVLTFYDQHYPRRDGKLRLDPCQSLETWQDAVNPTPDVAGLREVLQRLLALPEAQVAAADRANWRRLLDELPPLPLSRAGDRTWLAPAAEIRGQIANVENPELYAVFPYRLYGVGRAELAVGRETFARRRFQRSGGWQQDAVHAACLGLTEPAKAAVVSNFSTSHGGSRFPAFWGPNYERFPAKYRTATKSLCKRISGQRMVSAQCPRSRGGRLGRSQQATG